MLTMKLKFRRLYQDLYIKGKTVLVIAHRMRTVENADKIIVLADGVVKEGGTHDELMKENGMQDL